MIQPKKKSPLRFIIPAAVAVLLGIGALVLSRFYVMADGRLYSRSSEKLDLTDTQISVAAYDKLTRELPGCDIHWNVPLGDSYFDSRAESVCLTGLSARELPLLGQFENLRFLDAAMAELTPGMFDEIQKMLPECSIRWSIPLGEERYPSDAESITLLQLPLTQVSNLRYFTRLSQVDARDCKDVDAIISALRKLPDCQFLYLVPIGGETYPQDSAEITVNGSRTDLNELLQKLGWFQSLEKVTVAYCNLSPEEQSKLDAKYPTIRFFWPLTIAGKTVSSEDTAISFAGQSLSEAELKEIRENLSRFASLEKLDLTGCSITDDQAFSICEAAGEVDVVWKFKLYNHEISTTDTELDFSGTAMESADAMEAVLPYMHHLEKVDLSDCGFSDEQMEELNRKYENIRFIWTLHISDCYHIRTDAKSFIASTEPAGYFTDRTVQRLRYCEDMTVLDLGQRVTFQDISFLKEMPQLEYLLLGDSQARDITPVGALENLIYLEIPMSGTQDLSPLLNCKKLKDLNICFTRTVDSNENFNTLKQMTWLERLWYSNRMIPANLQPELAEALADTEIYVAYDTSAIHSGGWRFHERYYDMRDALGMFYMGEYGEKLDYKVINGEKIYPEDEK